MRNLWHISNGFVVDPLYGTQEKKDIFVKNGQLAHKEECAGGKIRKIDATGLIVTPGFIDMHVHFRDPGFTEAEDILSGSRAAAKGGFTSVVTMPNTNPAIDSAELVMKTIKAGRRTALVRLLPAGCLSEQRQGLVPANIKSMSDTGAIAFTDDGSTVSNTDLMKEIMKICGSLDLLVLDHAEDSELSGNGVVNKQAPEKLNLPGIPEEAETSIVERDIKLAQETGCRIHIQHISSKKSLNLIRKALNQGLCVSAEATPHHIALSHNDIKPGNPNYKMNPPLRSEEDRKALISAISDGTIKVLATDHAPHTAESKSLGFFSAPFGVVGLETAIGITYSVLVRDSGLRLCDWVRLWTTGPASILGLPAPSFEIGQRADLTLLNLSDTYTIDPSTFVSKSANTPFAGMKVKGQAVFTMMDGENTWKAKPLEILNNA